MVSSFGPQLPSSPQHQIFVCQPVTLLALWNVSTSILATMLEQPQSQHDLLQRWHDSLPYRLLHKDTVTLLQQGPPVSDFDRFLAAAPWCEQMPCLPSVPSPRVVPKLFRDGESVVTRALSGSKRNGRLGTILDWLPDQQPYRVRMSAEKVLSLGHDHVAAAPRANATAAMAQFRQVSRQGVP